MAWQCRDPGYQQPWYKQYHMHVTLYNGGSIDDLFFSFFLFFFEKKKSFHENI